MSLHNNINNLAQALRARAAQTPSAIAFRYLHDDDEGETALTFAELERRARAVGAELQRSHRPGSRALLVFQHDLEFIVGFFGCIFGGLVAVPVMPPDPARVDRTLPRFLSAVRDADVSVVLSTTKISAMRGLLSAAAPDLAKLAWLTTDTIELTRADDWTLPEMESSSLAFIHYTSGSTAAPKGVMVSHANAFANLSLIGHFGNVREGTHFVSWIPFYHNIGLIVAVIGAVVLGYTSTFLSPLSFLQQPLRWLRAIARFRATHTAAPNFAYDLCTRTIRPEERATLDLSSLEFAVNGAEPIHPDVLATFTATFAECGFKNDAFALAYGMAEHVVFNSVGGKPCVVRELDADALTEGRAELATPSSRAIRRLVSCGRTRDDHRIVVVNPDTKRPCAEGEVGELWLSGPSVTLGYWRKPEETEQVFGGYLDTGEGPFLRSGDLGFLRDGEVSLTGRLKELIIVRGANHYPQDIERTVERAHPAISSDQGAAFSIDVNGSEELVIGYEADLSASDPNEIFAAIRRAVAQEHGLRVHAIAILKAGTMPKTAIGKRQRRALRDGFVAQTLDVQAISTSANVQAPPAAKNKAASSLDQRAIVDILRASVADAVGIEAVEVDPRQSFATYGLDSKSAVALSASLGERFGLKLKATLAYDYPTVDKLGRYIAELLGVYQGPSADKDVGREAPSTEGRFPPIAIVGIGCRMPGSEGPRAFWTQLCEGLDQIGDVPEGRPIARAFQNEDSLHYGKSGRLAGFVKDVDRFDHDFFGISKREASRMDPQQRLLLEVSWEAFEDAGIRPSSFAGTRTGVFVGIATHDYVALQLATATELDPYAMTGNASSIAANRLSYFFDLHGPSVAVDTACSSSLVALHLACTSLWMGDCTAALAGGVNLILTPTNTANLAKSGMLAMDGHCRPFDAHASGYVRGEGAGVVVLKPLSQALADGDRVYAVIRATAVNQDGRTNGLTAPNGKAQEVLLRTAYERAGVAPASVQYVEAQGTGTRLGDPIEANALAAVLCEDRSQDEELVVGSVKGNIGHLEAAAGIASVVKASLATYHGQLPKTLHFSERNPHIHQASNLRIQDQLSGWPRPSQRRLAGVSAFGFGGTNAHVVLEQAPEATPLPASPERPAYLLLLSAHTEAALRDSAKRYAEALSGGGDLASVPLGDVCAAAMSRREALPTRAAFVGANGEELVAKLRARAALDASSDAAKRATGAGAKTASPSKVGFVFSGQDAIDVARARDLFEGERVFRDAFRAFDAKVGALSSVSLEATLRSPRDNSAEDAATLEPLLVGIHVALLALWASWGITPDAVVGHGVGEISAAYAAGILAPEDAARIAVLRGQRTSRAHGQGICEPLASHAEELAHLLAELKTNEPAIAMYSAVSGERVTAPLDGTYWTTDLQKTVPFADAAMAMMKDGVGTFVEVGPHPLLAEDIRQSASAAGVSISVLPSLHKEKPAIETMLASLGALFERGRDLISGTHAPHVEGLPTYPWQRVRCWLVDERPVASAPEELRSPLVGLAEAATAVLDNAKVLAAEQPGGARSKTTEIVAYLTTLVAGVLGVAPAEIAVDARLDTLGVESIMLMELHQRVHRDLGTDLPLDVLYERPTLMDLAEHIRTLRTEQAA